MIFLQKYFGQREGERGISNTAVTRETPNPAARGPSYTHSKSCRHDMPAGFRPDRLYTQLAPFYLPFVRFFLRKCKTWSCLATIGWCHRFFCICCLFLRFSKYVAIVKGFFFKIRLMFNHTRTHTNNNGFLCFQAKFGRRMHSECTQVTLGLGRVWRADIVATCQVQWHFFCWFDSTRKHVNPTWVWGGVWILWHRFHRFPLARIASSVLCLQFFRCTRLLFERTSRTPSAKYNERQITADHQFSNLYLHRNEPI